MKKQISLLVLIGVFSLVGCGSNPTCTITWKNYDGQVLEIDENVQFNQMPKYDGEAPTKESDEQYSYTFKGWTPEVVAADGDKTYTATYTSVVRTYTAKWFDDDRTTLLHSQSLKYGETPTYTWENPTKQPTDRDTFTFVGWDKGATPIHEDVSFYAMYKSDARKYVVTFLDEDEETVLDQKEVEYGVEPRYEGERPNKEPSGGKIYHFNGWDKEIVPATSNQIYIATYAEYTGTFTVIFDKQGGYGGIPHVNVTYNELMEPVSVPTKEEVSFMGYYAEPDGQGTKYFDENGQCVHVWDQYKDSQYYLYAFWQVKIMHSITYELNGGHNNSENPEVFCELDSVILKDPYKYKDIFEGWYLDSEFKNRITEIPVGTKNDVTVYAKWLLNIEYFEYDIVDNGIIVTGITNKCQELKVLDFEAINETLPSEYKIVGFGEYAFEDDQNVYFDNIIIPHTVTTISEKSFAYALTQTVTIPDSVKTIENNGFFNSYISFITIPESVETIGGGAFLSCKYLQSVVISNGVTSIGGWAFKTCESLASITIPSSVSFIGSDAFLECKKLEKVNITDLNTWCNMTFENVYANPLCYGCDLYLNDELVETLTIPASVASICKFAFYGCTSIKTLYVSSGVRVIGNSAFCDCKNLETVNIPSSVETIDMGAFYECFALTSVSIANGVKTIGDFAFNDCTSLTEIFIPFSVETMGKYVFGYCGKLTIYCAAEEKPAGWSSDWNNYGCPVVWGSSPK